MYFTSVSAPTAESLCLLLLSMLALESAVSIRSLYRHFLSKLSKKSLNAFYYACSHANVDYSRFMNVTVRTALKIIPDGSHSFPVFLCVDDTMVPKYGTHFEEASVLFDHAAHNGSHYLKGHCFVSLLLCVPVWKKDSRGKKTFSYLSVPLGYRLWRKTETKLELAASMVRQVMPELVDRRNVLVLCDSWYAKKKFLCLADEFPNLDMICGARTDSALYDLPPKPTGRRGRPAKKGTRLSLDDVTLSEEKIDGWHIGWRWVLTNLFPGRPVLAYVTSSKKKGGSRRLFLSTIVPADISLACAWYEDAPINQTGYQWMEYLPLFLYKLRWNIETCYYEQKTFWSLCKYMVRNVSGMEMMVNLVNVAYSAMKLLPYLEEEFAGYQSHSVQEFRFTLSERIREQVIFASFVGLFENGIKSNTVINLLKQKVCGFYSCTQKL